ncbi:MAG: hypothetical protein AAGB22_14275, partial [Bacteroidota bacterium]
NYPVSNRQDDIVDGVFQRGFEHAKATPSRDLWAGIEASLDQPSQSRSLVWVRWAAAAAIALLVTGDAWWAQQRGPALAQAVQPGTEAAATILEQQVTTEASGETEPSNRETGTETAAGPLTAGSATDESPRSVAGPQPASAGTPPDIAQATQVPQPAYAARHTTGVGAPGLDAPDHTPTAEKAEKLPRMTARTVTQLPGAELAAAPMIVPLPVETFAKSDPPTWHDRGNRWLLAGHYGPAVASAQLASGTGTPEFSELANANALPTEANSDVNGAYSTGMQFGYRVGDRLEIYSGFSYTSLDGTVTSFVSDQGALLTLANEAANSGTLNEPDGFLGLVEVNTLQDSASSNYQFQYMELPIALRYHLVNRRLKYYVASGVSAQLFSRLVSE